MRRFQKNKIIELLNTLSKAHKTIDDIKNDEVQSLLAECQQTAIVIGTMIEESEGEGTDTVHKLEEYCEQLFQFGNEFALGNIEKEDIVLGLNRTLSTILERFISEIPEKRLIVFLPYKASMWDSFETVWEDEQKDTDNEVMVIPIPYYDKNPDGSFGEMHDEHDMYPLNVPIADWREVDLEKLHPDRVYIHNPYDEGNKVTSVEPRFYAKAIKKQTDELVYIPYFVLQEPELDNENELENLQSFVLTSGVIQSSRVIVQSEVMKQAYIKILTKSAPGIPAEVWEKKIEGTGSPKVERLLKLRERGIEIPEEWKRVILKPDGSRKTVVLYNTSLSTLLNEGEKHITKIKNVLKTFYDVQDDIALIWRPHPLFRATIKSQLPEFVESYDAIVSEYRTQGWGIYDESEDMTPALILSKGYYGDMSSLVWLYQKLEKPIMIENVDVE